jgi:hypothetical protein
MEERRGFDGALIRPIGLLVPSNARLALRRYAPILRPLLLENERKHYCGCVAIRNWTEESKEGDETGSDGILKKFLRFFLRSPFPTSFLQKRGRFFFRNPFASFPNAIANLSPSSCLGRRGISSPRLASM